MSIDKARYDDSVSFRKLRELCGWVNDGSETTVKISQDDATRTFHIQVGEKRYWGDSFAEAIDKAAGAAPAPADMRKPEDGGTLIDRLQGYADDPMWAAHAEVPKSLLHEALATIAERDRRIAELEAGLGGVREKLAEWLDAEWRLPGLEGLFDRVHAALLSGQQDTGGSDG